MVSLPTASNTKRRGFPRRRAASRRSPKKAQAQSRQNSRGKRRVRRSRAQARSPMQPRNAFQLGLLEQSKKKFDAPLLLITVMLLVVGLIALLSASYPKGYYSSEIGPFYYFIRQLGMAAVGLVLMWGVSCIDYTIYKRWAFILYFISFVMLVLVLTPLGTSLNNAQRWLFGFQPSEVAKLAIILLFSTMASARPESVRSVKGLLVYVALIGIYILLLAMEPHMSASMILIVIGFVILFVAGMHVWFLVPIGIGGVIIAVIAYFTLNHVQERINIFLNPFLDAKDTGYQSVQSLIAIGSGGAFGLGLGQSRQKFLYLPEPMNDFIFSVICEEMGFVGAALILVLFAYFVYRGFSIARRAADRFGCLLATGITMQFAFQILLNLAVVTGLFPVTGASLPLFSYGGTALVMQLVEIGILLNISRNIPPSKKE
ncbi:putative lipid II flippase FtsW [Butyricicoccus sp.]|uniref:putative lipid II flippase FtsW n=1 Tax=Butyricicoccus sp. TaxID=2049021 RepID=UPI003F1371DB